MRFGLKSLRLRKFYNTLKYIFRHEAVPMDLPWNYRLLDMVFLSHAEQ